MLKATGSILLVFHCEQPCFPQHVEDKGLMTQLHYYTG